MHDASQRAATPGLALALTGALALLVALVGLVLQLVAVVPGLLAAVSAGALTDWLVGAGPAVAFQLVWSLLSLVGGVLTLLGGLRLRALKSPSLVTVGAIAAMIPCCNLCCVVGLATGGWALYTLRDDEVRAAMADA